MKIDGTTTFTQIHQGGEFEGKANEKHLRLSGDTLHLHREDKSSGVHFLDQGQAPRCDGGGQGLDRARPRRRQHDLQEPAHRQECQGRRDGRHQAGVRPPEAGLGTAGKALPQNLELVPVKGHSSLMAGRLSHATQVNELQGMTDQIDRTLAGLRDSQSHPEVSQ